MNLISQLALKLRGGFWMVTACNPKSAVLIEVTIPCMLVLSPVVLWLTIELLVIAGANTCNSD